MKQLHDTIAEPAPGPLRVMFCITSMPVGGAETLLVNLIDRMDRSRLAPELCCLKQLGPLGEQLAGRIPTFNGLLSHKIDLRVWPRLVRLFRQRRIDAVVTVGAGDKMFWGRLAARQAGVPVVISALHSTGWPDSIGRLNRLLTPWTDAFVGVAQAHATHLSDIEGFPADRVHVIPNGVDVERFSPSGDRRTVRAELGIADAAPVVGIVAALRPEKNHPLLLRAMRHLLQRDPPARLVLVGDGPQRKPLEQMTADLGISHAVRFLGNRYDTHRLLPAFDCFALSSRIEASPVSILEAMASRLPVVATRVGSVAESVIDGETGYLVESGAT
ncbi:MAG: glycosyltransferase, partial [Pirellulales bacterium]